MIFRWQDKDQELNIRRFRIDILIIGTGGGIAAFLLLFLLSRETISFTIFFLPFLLSLAALFFGFSALHKQGFENITLNRKKKFLYINKPKDTVQEIPFHKINQLILKGKSFKSLYAVCGSEEYCLFESFFLTKKLFSFCEEAEKSGLGLSIHLQQMIKIRGKSLRMFIIGVFIIWLMISLIYFVTKAAR